ncbi:GRIP and coiled-coil domain-containing protein 1-like [Rhipicephalus sanguineus]|uniref:GRIP and coiled-coil domain-containing protein 1-like n=1 Tax=Rhipicephalus sanguineus TaxID=34632 RepID=UPI0018953244|nr:GRIP and coiled-coil domain-containing protein 1-like [Rhipicephalus sanguineus]
MNRLKMKRTTRRAQNTKLIQEASALLENDDATVRQIDSIYERLKSNNEELKKINDEMESHISDEAFEAEYATVIEYEDNATRILAELQSKRRQHSETSPVSPHIEVRDVPAAMGPSECREINGRGKGRLQRYETRIEERVRARKSQRLEPAFYAIHKRSIQENNDAQVQVQRRLIEETTSMDTNMAKRRLKLREEQTAREREHTDHAIMLKELQRLLFEGRTFHENFEDNLEKVMREAAQAHVAMEYESKIQNLTQELDEVRKRLLVSEEKLRLIFPLLLKMQQLGMEQCEIELEKQKRQPGHVVEHQQTTRRETEMGSLENRLKELSQAGRTHDWLRMQDCAAIQQIQERPSLLTREDATSSSAARIGPKNTELPSQQMKPEREDIAGPFWQQAPAAETVEAPCAESPVDLLAYIRELAGEDVLSLHAKAREKLRQLKEESEK